MVAEMSGHEVAREVSQSREWHTGALERVGNVEQVVWNGGRACCQVAVYLQEERSQLVDGRIVLASERHLGTGSEAWPPFARCHGGSLPVPPHEISADREMTKEPAWRLGILVRRECAMLVPEIRDQRLAVIDQIGADERVVMHLRVYRSRYNGLLVTRSVAANSRMTCERMPRVGEARHPTSLS